jgi:hypothetical protein
VPREPLWLRWGWIEVLLVPSPFDPAARIETVPLLVPSPFDPAALIAPEAWRLRSD